MTTEIEERKKLIDELRLYVHDDNENCDLANCPKNCDVKHDLDLDTSIAWSLAYFLRRPNESTDEDNIATLDITIAMHRDKYTRLYKLTKRAEEMGRPEEYFDC